MTGGHRRCKTGAFRAMLRHVLVVTAIIAIPQARAGEIVQAGDAYYRHGQATLAARRAIRSIEHRARNVILFIADGNGIGSNTAIRIADGQRQGMAGEQNVLAYEAFPHLALSKTYNIDAQIPDSAGTATAMLSGVKTRKGVVGVGPQAVRGDCASALANPVVSLGELAEAHGLATGIVTTARLTHGTPAAFYAHSADRNWEDDAALPLDLPPDLLPGTPCKDIARQLAGFPFEVAMGGGRQHFLPKGTIDIEGAPGLRLDGRDLTAEWQAGCPGHAVVRTGPEFDRLAVTRPDRVLGLFSPDHMAFEADRGRDPGGEPSLAEMTRAAIEILDRAGNGYFLLVEAGRIDHALHGLDRHRAVTEGLALNEAVRMAAVITDAADTLIIVTSDHENQMEPWSYGPRGAPVVDFAGWRAEDHPPREYAPKRSLGASLTDLFARIALRRPPPTPRRPGPGSHGAADVAIYARGPMAYLFGGTVEQNYIFHVISHALGFDAPE
jgi:alkaline phosphatase